MGVVNSEFGYDTWSSLPVLGTGLSLRTTTPLESQCERVQILTPEDAGGCHVSEFEVVWQRAFPLPPQFLMRIHSFCFIVVVGTSSNTPDDDG